MAEDRNPLLGKTITAVYLAADKGALRFDVSGGEPVIARAYGDCCSHTWIEHVELPETVIGSPVLGAEDIPMPDLGSPDEYECLQYYGFKIRLPRAKW